MYMFIDYDGVVKTFAENFPFYHKRKSAPFSHSMMRVLSYIAWKAKMPAYFIPISSTPGNYSKGQLKTMFVNIYGINNLDLHPIEEIVPVRTDRHLFVKQILEKYQPRYHLVLDDEYFWYEKTELNYFQTDTYNGITHNVFCQLWDFAEQIANQGK